MANGNDIKSGGSIPEKPLSPEAIPVDDKGQPLPDPSETLSGYIVPGELDSLKKSFAQAEEDEDIKDTMEPPQRTNFFRKHKPGSRGYDYYGTPAGSIPNDSNGLKPSPLTKLFAEAEPFDVVPDEDDELPPELPEEPIFEAKPVETPKQTSKDINSVSDARELFAQAGYRVVDDDPVFTKKEVTRDESAPRLRDLYKTNTKVIFEAGQNGENIAKQENTAPVISENTAELFKEDSKISRTKKRLKKKQERKALKAQIKLEKKKARLQKKADRAAQKAKLKAEKQKSKNKISSSTDTQDIFGGVKSKTDETAAEKARLQKQEAIEVAKKAKEEAQRAIDEANRQKEEAQRAAKQAAEKLLEERERNLRQAQSAEVERVNSEKQALNAKQKLEEEKAKAEEAAKEAKKALEEAEKIKAELSAMKEAAAAALIQKQEAEEAAQKAREEKARLDEEAKKRKLEEKQRQEELAAKRAARLKREEARKAETEKIRMERDEAIAKAHAEKEAAIAKAKAEKEAALAKAKAEKEAAIAKAKQEASLTKNNSKSKDIYSNSKTADEIKRKIAEMESKLSAPKDIYISENKRPIQKEEPASPEFSISKENIISRSAKKDDSSDESSKI